MYKVFVNESLLILTNEKPKNNSGNVFLMEDGAITYAVTSLFKKKLDVAYIYDPSEKIVEKFSTKIPLVLAAGGLVKNKEGKVLFIYRNNKWDLPKGKLDKGESIEQAALREVEEETGVTGLIIDKYLKTTYHIFKRNREYRLKKVFWFEMHTKFKGELVAEQSEGITKVKWKSKKKIEKALKNSYKNIQLLFED